MGFMHIKTLKRSTVTILILHTKVLRLNNISKVTDLVSSREVDKAHYFTFYTASPRRVGGRQIGVVFMLLYTSKADKHGWYSTNVWYA